VKTKRNPASIHTPFSTYSHQIELVNEKRLLAISGQIGVDAEGQTVAGVSAQLKLAWQNVGENLHAAGMTYDDVIKLTVYLVHGCIDTDDRRTLFVDVFGGYSPCMTMLYVSALGDPDMQVELDVWASAE